MTNEQWLIYLYSIYPTGGLSFFLVMLLVATSAFLIICFVYYTDSDYPKNSTWYKLGKWKVVVPTILVTWVFLCSLVPSKQGFLYIVATPYVVESGKTLIESLDDKTSKLYKLNQLLDASLDTYIKNLETPKE